MNILSNQQQDKEEQHNSNQQEIENWQQIIRLITLENKNISQINELRSALSKYAYFQMLFGFVSSLFSCFDFLSTFIKIFEILNPDDRKNASQGDLIIRTGLEGEEVCQASERTFLDEYNWIKVLRKKQGSMTDLTPTTMSQTLLIDQQSVELSLNLIQNDQITYLIIKQNNFQKIINKYAAQRSLIFSNISKCIPLVSKITSTRMQDTIIKNVEIINLLEGTIINDPDLLNSPSPRLKYYQKNVHKSALWFLIQGDGIIEKKINQTTKISISIMSEGSLFGEEILFNSLCNTTQANLSTNQFDKEESSDSNEYNFDKFQLKLRSKVSHLYFIPVDKFNHIFPNVIIQDVKSNFLEKIKSRQEILKSKLISLQPENKTLLQTINKSNANEDQSKRIIIKKQQNEVQLLSKKMSLDRLQESNKKLQQNLFKNAVKENIFQTIQKKEEVLAYQQKQNQKRASIQDYQSVLSDRPYTSERSISQNDSKRVSIQQIIQKRTLEVKNELGTNTKLPTERKSIDELNLLSERDSKQTQNVKNPKVQQVSVEKKYLEKKIKMIMNQGFDFGHDNSKAELKKDQSIRILSIKTGVLNPAVNVKHPSLSEKQEKDALKKQQKIKQTSIIQGMDDSINQQIYTYQTPLPQNKSQNIPNQINSGDKKPSFYLTSKDKYNESSQRSLNNQQISYSSRKSSFVNFLIGNNLHDEDKSLNRGSNCTPLSNKIRFRPSTSQKRTSESSIQGKSEEMLVGPFTLNLLQIQNNVNEENRGGSNTFRQNRSTLSDNSKPKQTKNFYINTLQKVLSNENENDQDSIQSEEEDTSYFGGAGKISQKLNHVRSQTIINSSNNLSSQRININKSYNTQINNENYQDLIQKIQQKKQIPIYEYKEQPKFFTRNKQNLFQNKKLFELDLSPLQQNNQQDQQIIQKNDFTSVLQGKKEIQSAQEMISIDHLSSPKQNDECQKSLNQIQENKICTNISQILQKNQRTRSFNHMNFASLASIENLEFYENNLNTSFNGNFKNGTNLQIPSIQFIDQEITEEMQANKEQKIQSNQDSSFNQNVNKNQNPNQQKVNLCYRSCNNTPRKEINNQQDSEYQYNLTGYKVVLQKSNKKAQERYLSTNESQVQDSQNKIKITPRKISYQSNSIQQNARNNTQIMQSNKATPRMNMIQEQQEKINKYQQFVSNQTYQLESQVYIDNFNNKTNNSKQIRSDSMFEIYERPQSQHTKTLLKEQTDQKQNLIPYQSIKRNENIDLDTFGIKFESSQKQNTTNSRQIAQSINISNKTAVSSSQTNQQQISDGINTQANNKNNANKIQNISFNNNNKDKLKEKFDFNKYLHLKAKKNSILKKGMQAMVKEQIPHQDTLNKNQNVLQAFNITANSKIDSNLLID